MAQEPRPREHLFPRRGEPPRADLAWVERRDPPRPSQWQESERYLVDDESLTALEVALRLGDPLLVTGEPGTGKTQLAHYAARRLGLGEPLHFQVRSTTQAQELKYTFDTIAYFQAVYERRQAALAEVDGLGAPRAAREGGALPDKRPYIQPGKLWEALREGRPRVLLIDEIDKAPRDFPNDLLHELEQMEFTVPELPQDHLDHHIRLADPSHRPLVIITSNSEHRLPEAFLRRCVYHHIQVDKARLAEIAHFRRAELGDLDPDLIDEAIRHFWSIKHDYPLRKPPSTHELLVWLRALAQWSGTSVEALRGMSPGQLPRLGLLLKTQEDLKAVRGETGGS